MKMSFFKEAFLLSKNKRPIIDICNDEPMLDNIIVAYNTTINCYDGNNYALLKSWVSKKGSQITCGPIFSPIENEFVFALDKNVIGTVYTQNYMQSSTFKLNVNIINILPNGKSDPIVLLEDCSLYSTAECMANPDNIKCNSNIDLKEKTLLGNFGFAVENQAIICLLIEEKDCTKLYTSELAPGDDILYTSTSLDITNKVINSCLFLTTNDSQCLAILLENGDLCSVKISSNEDGNFVNTVKLILKLEITGSSRIVNAGVNKVAILCKQNILKVIEMELGAVVATLQLGTRLKNIDLFSVKSAIVVKTTSTVNIYSYTNETSTLASIVDNQDVHEKVEEIDNVSDVANNEKSEENENLNNIVEVQNTEEDMEDNDWDLSVCVKTLMHTIDEQNFDMAWEKLWESSTGIARIQLSNSNKIKQILQRFDEKQPFWPCNTILKMLKTKQFPGRLFGQAINKVIGLSDWKFVLVYLENAVNIPEEVLILIINGIFKSNMESVMNDELLSTCVDNILGQDYSEISLKNKMQALDIDVVIKFIKYMQDKIEITTTLSKQPTLDNLVLWISCVFDAHLSSMVLVEDCWPLIESVQQTVKKQMDIFKELNLIGIYYNQIKSKMIFHTNNEYTKYVVENMYL